MSSLARVGLYTTRDLRILQRARGHVSFDSAVGALKRSVEAEIPDGHVFVLGTGAHAPVLGSLITRIGITRRADGRVVVVHFDRGAITELEAL